MKKLMVLSAVHNVGSFRAEVYEMFLRRMAHIRDKFGVETLVVGSEGKLSKDTTEEAGAWYIERENKPVSDKWNEGLLSIKKHNPDYVMILGSDDLVSDALIERYLKEIESGRWNIIGIKDSYFIALSVKNGWFGRFIYWPGYPGGAMMGCAKCISKEVLDAVNWKLWPDAKNSGMDFGSNRIIGASGVKLRVLKLNIREEGLFHIDIKTRGNISSVSPLIRRSEDADFNETILEHLPMEEALTVISYRDSMMEMYKNRNKTKRQIENEKKVLTQ